MPLQQRIILIFLVIVLVLGGGAITYNMFGNSKLKTTKTSSSLYVPPVEKPNPKSAINKKPSVADQNQLEQKQPDITQKGTFSDGQTVGNKTNELKTNNTTKPDSNNLNDNLNGVQLATDRPKENNNKAKVLEKFSEGEQSEILPPSLPVSFSPTESQKTAIQKQLKIDIKNISKYTSNALADGTVIFKIPYTNIKNETWDIPSGLLLAGDQSYGSNQDRVFVLKDDVFFFAGDNVSNIFDFEYEGEVFWMNQYLDKIVITKTNFVDPQSVNFLEGRLIDIQKKNNAEFNGMFVGYDPEANITKIYTITPQKYFIDEIVFKDLANKYTQINED